MKKAQGMSVNVIIIAAIALLVLVVLSVIFLGRISVFGQGVNSCEAKQGQVCRSATTGCGSDFTAVPGQKCYDASKQVDSTRVCCAPIS